jgi:hypothetical protein
VERAFHHGHNVARLAGIFQALPSVHAKEIAA